MPARDFLKNAIRRLLRWEVMRVGENSYAALPAEFLHEAWFSLETQRTLLMRRSEVDLVIDVGANVGQFGQSIRRSYPGELLSFEPSSVSFDRLRTHASADPHWRTVHCALGAEEAELQLQITPLSVLSSFLKPNEFSETTFGTRAKPVSTEVVRVRTFDDAVTEMVPDASRRRMFVKLDTQGFDLQVFRGMQGLLESVVCLQSEVSLRPIYEGMPGWLESLAVYEEAGFRVVGLFPAACEQSGIPIEYDCLMCRDATARAEI